MLDAEVKRFTKQLAQVRAAQEEGVIERQAKMDALDDKKREEREVLVRSHKL